MKVEYARGAEPAALSFVTKTSNEPLCTVSKAPAVVGKLPLLVSPVMYALPPLSTAIPKPRSEPLPPRNVE